MAHLWEIDHPYYCQEGNYFKSGQHTLFASWTDFTEETLFYRGDRDQNLLIRWDWHKPGHYEWEGEETLLLFFVLQRKAWLCSVEMPVTEVDESAIHAWLTECAQTMRATWEPLLDALQPAA